jgi:hypothetical protein
LILEIDFNKLVPTFLRNFTEIESRHTYAINYSNSDNSKRNYINALIMKKAQTRKDK